MKRTRRTRTNGLRVGTRRWTWRVRRCLRAMALTVFVALLGVACAGTGDDGGAEDGGPATGAATGDTAAPTAPAEEAARRELDSLRTTYLEAKNARDAEGVLATMTPDVVYLAPLAPPLLGTEAVGGMLRTAYAEWEPAIEMTPVELVVRGDVALEWGCLGGSIRALDGSEVMQNSGKYLLAFTRVPGEGWRIFRDVYNQGPCQR